MQTDKRWTR